MVLKILASYTVIYFEAVAVILNIYVCVIEWQAVAFWINSASIVNRKE